MDKRLIAWQKSRLRLQNNRWMKQVASGGYFHSIQRPLWMGYLRVTVRLLSKKIESDNQNGQDLSTYRFEAVLKIVDTVYLVVWFLSYHHLWGYPFFVACILATFQTKITPNYTIGEKGKTTCNFYLLIFCKRSPRILILFVLFRHKLFQIIEQLR